MGNYVSIKSSPSELINVADKLRDKGTALKQNAGAIEQDIRDHETGTFPSDQFTDAFTGKTYHQMVPGPDGDDMEARYAVTMAGRKSGEQLERVGEYVSKAMVNYDVADMDNASQITKHTATATRTD